MFTGTAIGFLIGAAITLWTIYDAQSQVERINSNPISRAMGKTATWTPNFIGMLVNILLYSGIGTAIGYLVS